MRNSSVRDGNDETYLSRRNFVGAALTALTRRSVFNRIH